MPSKIYLGEKRVRELHAAGWTALAIGKELGASKYRIWLELQRLQVVPHSTSIRDKLDAVAIVALYKKHLSAAQIANRLRVSRPTIVKILKAADVDIRGSVRYLQLQDPEWLRRMYWTEGLSIDQIAKRLGCGYSVVLAFLNKYGIETRSVSEGIHLSYAKGRKPHSKGGPRRGQPLNEKHRQAVAAANRSLASREAKSRKMSGRIFTPEHAAKISVALKERWKDPALLASVSGPNSHLWQGGKNLNGYPQEWRRIARKIRERDNRTCQLCGVKETPGFAHDVHHISYVPEESEPANLVTLCKNCHSRTNTYRDEWRAWFESNRGNWLAVADPDGLSPEARARTELRIRRYRTTQLGDVAWLKEQAAVKSTKQIAREIGCTPPTVARALDWHHIPRRKHGRFHQLYDAEWFRKEYESKGPARIARDLGCSNGAVYLATVRHGIRACQKDQLQAA